MKIWPRTLAVQMIAVTAAAVVISNFAVAWWFELGNERQKETALNERVLDRAAAVAATLIAIPPDARGAVMHSMNSPHLWQFADLRPGDEITRPMSEEGNRLAQRLSASLPPQARVGRATVRRGRTPACARGWPRGWPRGPPASRGRRPRSPGA